MPNISFKRLYGGLIKDYGGATGSVLGAENQYARSTGIDFYRRNFQGMLSPAQKFDVSALSLSDANIDSLIRACAVDITNLNTTQSTPFIFFMLGGLSGTAPRVVRANTSSGFGYDSNNPIGNPAAHSGHNFTTVPSNGTGFWGEDIIFYRANVGGTPTNLIFYSWNDNADGDVGKATLAGIYDDDFMSTVPASPAVLTANVPHRLEEGPDGLLYITNGRYVSTYDGLLGNEGTFELAAYDLGLGWIATDVRRDGNNVVITAVKAGASFLNYSFSSESKSTFWDGAEAGLGVVREIPDNFVSTLYKVGSRLFAFSKGRNGTTKLWEWLGDWKQKFEHPTAIIGTPPDPRSIDYYNGRLYWTPGDASGGYVLSYDLENDGVHIPSFRNDGTNDDGTSLGGLLKNIDGNNLYSGGKYAATYKLVGQNGSGGYMSSVNLRSRKVFLPFKSTITDVRVLFGQMESGSSVTLSIFRNNASMIIGGANDLLNTTIDYATFGSLGEKHIDSLAITDVSNFYMNVNMNGQMSIEDIIVTYQPSQPDQYAQV